MNLRTEIETPGKCYSSLSMYNVDAASHSSPNMRSNLVDKPNSMRCVSSKPILIENMFQEVQQLVLGQVTARSVQILLSTLWSLFASPWWAWIGSRRRTTSMWVMALPHIYANDTIYFKLRHTGDKRIFNVLSTLKVIASLYILNHLYFTKIWHPVTTLTV